MSIARNRPDFEIKLFPDKEHSIGPEASDMAIDFFQRRLMAKDAEKAN